MTTTRRVRIYAGHGASGQPVAEGELVHPRLVLVERHHGAALSGPLVAVSGGDGDEVVVPVTSVTTTADPGSPFALAIELARDMPPTPSPGGDGSATPPEDAGAGLARGFARSIRPPGPPDSPPVRHRHFWCDWFPNSPGCS